MTNITKQNEYRSILKGAASFSDRDAVCPVCGLVQKKHTFGLPFCPKDGVRLIDIETKKPIGGDPRFPEYSRPPAGNVGRPEEEPEITVEEDVPFEAEEEVWQAAKSDRYCPVCEWEQSKGDIPTRLTCPKDSSRLIDISTGVWVTDNDEDQTSTNHNWVCPTCGAVTNSEREELHIDSWGRPYCTMDGTELIAGEYNEDDEWWICPECKNVIKIPDDEFVGARQYCEKDGVRLINYLEWTPDDDEEANDVKFIEYEPSTKAKPSGYGDDYEDYDEWQKDIGRINKSTDKKELQKEYKDILSEHEVKSLHDQEGVDWEYNAYGVPQRIKKSPGKTPTLEEHYKKNIDYGDREGWGGYGHGGGYGSYTPRLPTSTVAGEIPIGTPGKLFHGAVYFGRDDMKKTFDDLKEKGVSVIWNLLEDKKATKEESENFEIVVATPIKDYGLPKSPTKFFEDAKYILSLLKSGKSVFIHCQAGHGRTGMAVSTLLIMSGMSIVDGIETAIDNCHGPETEQQIYFVVDLFTVNKPETQEWWSYDDSDQNLKKQNEYRLILQKQSSDDY